MAAGRRHQNANLQGRERDYRSTYVYGNAVPVPDYHPEPTTEDSPAPKRGPNPQIKRNRRRARSIDGSYTFYIFATSAIAVLACVFYLQLQVDNMNRANNVAYLQNRLAQAVEQNDVTYQAVSRAVNLEVIRSRAINYLGMRPKCPEQVIEYQNPNNRHVIVHNEIPAHGVIP